MNSNYEARLGQDPIAPLIFRMALPTVAAQLVNLLYNLVDRIYIGHIPGIGNDALAGVGVTSSVIVLISAFSSIVSGGGAPLASIAMGQGNHARAERILGNGFLLLILFTVGTASVSYAFLEPLLRLIGASDVTLPYAMDYLSIYLAGTLFVQLSTGLNTFITAQGRPGVAMLSVMIGAGLNTILDPIFIFYFGMNVAGAAWATILSQGCSAAFVLGFLFSRHASLRIRWSCVRPDRKVIGAMLALGVSPFIMASTESLVGFVLNGSLRPYGDIYVSALTVMQSAMQLVSVPLTGFSQGFVPVISYNYGHGDSARVRGCLKVVFPVMVLFNLIMVLAMVLFPSAVASLFTDSAVLRAEVRWAMPLFLSGMTIFGLQRTCQNIFVSLGQAKISLFIALLRKIILLIPLVLIFNRIWHLPGIFVAETVADATAAITCTIIFAIRFPKLMKKLDEAPQSPAAG